MARRSKKENEPPNKTRKRPTASKARKAPKAATKSTAHRQSVRPVVLSQLRPKADGRPFQCWAHTRAGTRCTACVTSREGEPIPIPYCDRHLRTGDGAVEVVSHPFAGKALVARYDLPSKYRLAYWGVRGKCGSCDEEDRAISYYPPDRRTGRNIDPNVKGGRTLKTNNYNGVLNPEGTGDVIQYAACPGPNEKQNMRSTFQYFGLRNGDVGGLEFLTLVDVPAGTQLLHWYGSDWWSARGLKRRDVGTEKNPAPLRDSVANKNSR